MCSQTKDLLLSITEAVDELDKWSLLQILHSGPDISQSLQGSDIYHRVVNALWHRWGPDSSAVPIIYLLHLHGADINHQDENGDTALLVYLRDDDNISEDVLVAFLRCGSDVTTKNKCGEDVLNLILQSLDLPKSVQARVLEFMPGLWRAVDSDDAMTVRRLINQWCSVRVKKDELSVVQLAFNKGTENIIRVITGIGPSMDLAHAVLAGDRTLVTQILKSRGRYNINMKNMGERGASPLFYALCQNDKEMVELLLENGARLNVPMEGENGMELPLYLAALSRQPQIEIDLMTAIIPKSPVAVDQLYYQGKNVIFFCIENNIHITLFEAILRKCSAGVLTQRIMENLDTREYAARLGKTEYVDTIDKVVHDWCSNYDSITKRNILVLHGYDFSSIELQEQAPVGSHNTVDLNVVLPQLEDCKLRLCEAVKREDLMTVKQILYEESWKEQGLDMCMADGRIVGDGQPLLHKAVMRNHTDIVRELALCLFHKCERKLDTIRDQYYRTALHYVYGMEDGKEMINILEDLGMSEYVMDKDGRSPQAFKDRRGQKEMRSLLQYHLEQDFTNPEPDPWSVKLPLPIVGYMTKCVHEHHEKKHRFDKSSEQYDSLAQANTAVSENNSYHSIRPQPTELENKYLTSSNVFTNIPGNGSNEFGHRYISGSDMIVNDSQNMSDKTYRGITHDDNGLFHSYQTDMVGGSFVREAGIDESSPVIDGYGGTRFDQYSVTSDLSEYELQPRLCKSKSVESLDSESYSSRDMCGTSLPKGDYSDSDSELGELEEDYDGDYSDIETDEESSTSVQANYCIIL